MVTQQAVALYVVLDGIERPLRPEVALRGQSKFDIRRYAQNDANGEIELDNSRVTTRTAYTLREARSDGYDSLARSQPLVRADKVPLDVMRETLGKFDDAVWKNYWIWAELMDSQPQLRGLKLPRGKNAFLYRGPWTVKEDYNIDVSAMDPEKDLVAVKVPTKDSAINQKWMDDTGARDDTYHWVPDLDNSKRNLNGLNALGWVFWLREWPDLYSAWRPGDGDSDGGALLGSRLSADEIVERFVKRTAETATQRLRIWTRRIRKTAG